MSAPEYVKVPGTAAPPAPEALALRRSALSGPTVVEAGADQARVGAARTTSSLTLAVALLYATELLGVNVAFSS